MTEWISRYLAVGGFANLDLRWVEVSLINTFKPQLRQVNALHGKDHQCVNRKHMRCL